MNLVCAAAICLAFAANAESVFLRAEEAYRHAEYDEAKANFEDYLGVCADGEFADIARFRIGESALAIGDFAGAFSTFSHLAESNGPLKDRSDYFAGLSLYRTGAYDSAAARWSRLVRRTLSDEVGAKAQYGIAWASIRRRDWDGADVALSRLPILFPTSDMGARAGFLRGELIGANDLSRRSPATAKWLSTFVPGSGQVYAGRTGNGLVSAGLNGGFFYVLARALNDRRWVDAAFIYALGSRFYWGGRHNAERFAVERNEREIERYIDGLSRFEE